MLSFKNFSLLIIILMKLSPANAIAKSAVFTVDMNKLLKLSEIGKDIADRNNRARQTLQNENEILESELLLEEQALSKIRKTISSDEFRAKATEFDNKVTLIRSEQAKKEQDLINKIRKEEAQFYKSVYPLLYELLSERGGLLLLDQRNVVLWDSSIDITDDAIVLINKLLNVDDKNNLGLSD